jgi:hypothetical protein
VGATRALIHIDTTDAITAIAHMTRASERANGVPAGAIDIAIVHRARAFIDIAANNTGDATIPCGTLGLEAKVAGTRERARSVAASGIQVAIVNVESTLIDIRTHDARSTVTHIAST